MDRQGGIIEVLKLVMISLALVFAITAFAMVLLKDGAGAGQPVRTIKIPEPPPAPPVIDEDKAAEVLWKRKLEEARQAEIAERDDRQKRADEAVAKLKAKYEKDGRLPERIVLETPTSRPVPEKPDPEAPPVGAPLVLYPHERRIEFDAYVILSKGQLVEVLLSGPRGRLHESLLKTFINPYDLWQALALLGLKQSYTARGAGDMMDLEGDRVIIEVEYKDKDGKKVRRRVEDLIYHFQKNTHMPYEGWVYVGSHFVETQDGQILFVAAEIENIATTWHRASPILDNPLKEGADDSLYHAYDGVVPDPGTEMRVIMTPDEEYNRKHPEPQPLTGR